MPLLVEHVCCFHTLLLLRVFLQHCHLHWWSFQSLEVSVVASVATVGESLTEYLDIWLLQLKNDP